MTYRRLIRFDPFLGLVDEKLADMVWEAWDGGQVDSQVAWLAWWLIVSIFSAELPYRRD